MLIIEIIVPFAMFGTDEMRLGVFFAFVGLQWCIWITGNFSYLNHLTVVLSTILVANAYMPTWLVLSSPAEAPSMVVDTLCSAFGTIFVILNLLQLWQHFLPNARLSSWLHQLAYYHISNRYGIFAIMTTQRFEIVFEGSEDGQTWKEYTFYYKPSEITRRPRRICPYQPRIEWQAWFLPLGHYRYDAWLENFIYRLLKGTPEVLKLIKHNPFPAAPPRFVRSLMYEYTFSSRQEKREHGWWWRRSWSASLRIPCF